MTFLSFFIPFSMVATTATCITLNYLMSDGSYGNGTMREIADKYRSDWSPSSWAFYIWPFLYVRFATFAIYVCVYRNELTQLPIVNWLATLYNISALLQSTWVYLFINEYVWESLIVIGVLAALTCWLAFASAVYIDIDDDLSSSEGLGSGSVIAASVKATRWVLHYIVHLITTEWMFRIYASWVMIATSQVVISVLRKQGTITSEDDMVLESIAIGYIWVHPFVFMGVMRFFGWLLFTTDAQARNIPRRFDAIAGLVMTWAAVGIATRDDIHDESLASRLVKWITVAVSAAFTIVVHCINRQAVSGHDRIMDSASAQTDGCLKRVVGICCGRGRQSQDSTQLISTPSDPNHWSVHARPVYAPTPRY